MAFLPMENKTIEVICSKDAAVQCTPEEYAQYLETLDEELLELDPETQPTRFVLNAVLDYKSVQRIENNKISYVDGDVGVKLGFIQEEIRTALVDIKNPGAKSIEFKKEGDGFASKRLVELLHANGIVAELYNARTAYVTNKTKATPKKKSQPSLSSPSPTPAS